MRGRSDHGMRRDLQNHTLNASYSRFRICPRCALAASAIFSTPFVVHTVVRSLTVACATVQDDIVDESWRDFHNDLRAWEASHTTRKLANYCGRRKLNVTRVCILTAWPFSM
jgi:hypothetical protein